MRRVISPRCARMSSYAIALMCQFSTNSVSCTIVLKHLQAKEKKSARTSADNTAISFIGTYHGLGMNCWSDEAVHFDRGGATPLRRLVQSRLSDRHQGWRDRWNQARL